MKILLPFLLLATAVVADPVPDPPVNITPGPGADANKKLTLASNAFFLAALGAFVATSAKLTLLLGDWHTPHMVPLILGSLAILLPVIAVGALSRAASFDLEARLLGETANWYSRRSFTSVT